MADDIFKIETISQLHQMLGYAKPKHPLVSVIDVEKMKLPPAYSGYRFSANFYSVSMKDSGCGMIYGRNYYDFEEGVLTFTAPLQVVGSTDDAITAKGWMLFFHPDLIRHSHLGQSMDQYSFFSYEVHEALHLSEKEEKILNDCIEKIEFEYNQSIDSHSQSLFVSNIELLLNYCLRFYERQFNTRKPHHTDVMTKVEHLLKDYYTANRQLEEGTPSIQYIANQVSLSPNYLSDLLKKETGRNAKDHINYFLVEKAKTMLLNSDHNVSEIAFDLGFNYPHYFSRLFKQKTGMTPVQFREKELN